MADAMHIIPDEARAVMKTVRSSVEQLGMKSKIYTDFIGSAYQHTNIPVLGELVGATVPVSQAIAELGTGDDSTFAKCNQELEKDARIAEELESGSNFNVRFKK